MGFSFYLYVNKEESKEDLYNIVATEKNNSPIQLISQIKGYFYINPYLAISLAITLFSFVGIPPIIGFFAKQMILSAALDSGYVFMTLVAIITSVIGAAYYLNLIKQIFFYKNDHEINPSINSMDLTAYISSRHAKVSSSPSENEIRTSNAEKIKFTSSNIVINSSFSSIIGILTLLLLLFIYIPGE
jgi:NADH-ubiquinone oxidoreductase chain 2